MYHIINWTWCLPQTLLGLIWFIYIKLSKNYYKSYKYKNAYLTEYIRMTNGVSLGYFIFSSGLDTTTRHEYGHYKQSLMLGPLYLLVIGLPSIMWAIVHSNFNLSKSYHSFYTEKWADKLGNVHIKYL